jgi:hypothetical protein
LEPVLNAGEVELLDHPTLTEQLVCLVWRGARIDHEPNGHDDFANAVAGVARLVRQRSADAVLSYDPIGVALRRDLGLVDTIANPTLGAAAEVAAASPWVDPRTVSPWEQINREAARAPGASMMVLLDIRVCSQREAR